MGDSHPHSVWTVGSQKRQSAVKQGGVRRARDSSDGSSGGIVWEKHEISQVNNLGVIYIAINVYWLSGWTDV